MKLRKSKHNRNRLKNVQQELRRLIFKYLLNSKNINKNFQFKLMLVSQKLYFKYKNSCVLTNYPRGVDRVTRLSRHA